MHLFAIFRGAKYDVERAINDLNAKYLAFDHKTHGKGVLGVMCNPIIPVELIFPKEHLSTIVNTLGGEERLKGQESIGYLRKYIDWIMRRAHLKPIENIDKEAVILPIHHENVEIIGLGIKEDKEFPDGTEYI